jgi:nucleoside-triphosphatase THEP1
MSTIHPHPRPAAILAKPDSATAGRHLIEFARKLQAAGLCVQGLVQETKRIAGQKTTMELVEIDTGKRFSIKQNLGQSASCQVDLQGVAEATQALRRALLERPDLVVVNKFSHLESEGQGLASEMLALMAEGIPLLTTVAPDYLEAWERFTGGLAVVLTPDPQSIDAWWRQDRPAY